MSPLDLHVLGTPPAFVLSQDQTLNKLYLYSFKLLKSFIENYLIASNLKLKLRQIFEMESGGRVSNA